MFGQNNQKSPLFPDELYNVILEHFNILELVKKAKLVDKNWKIFADKLIQGRIDAERDRLKILFSNADSESLKKAKTIIYSAVKYRYFPLLWEETKGDEINLFNLKLWEVLDSMNTEGTFKNININFSKADLRNKHLSIVSPNSIFVGADLTNATLTGNCISVKQLEKAKSLRGLIVKKSEANDNNFTNEDITKIKTKIIKDYYDYFDNLNNINEFAEVLRKLYRRDNTFLRLTTGLFENDYDDTASYKKVCQYGERKIIALINEAQDLKGVDLHDIDLQSVHLKMDVDLTGANLENTNINHKNLINAKSLMYIKCDYRIWNNSYDDSSSLEKILTKLRVNFNEYIDALDINLLEKWLIEARHEKSWLNTIDRKHAFRKILPDIFMHGAARLLYGDLDTVNDPLISSTVCQQVAKNYDFKEDMVNAYRGYFNSPTTSADNIVNILDKIHNTEQHPLKINTSALRPGIFYQESTSYKDVIKLGEERIAILERIKQLKTKMSQHQHVMWRPDKDINKAIILLSKRGLHAVQKELLADILKESDGKYANIIECKPSGNQVLLMFKSKDPEKLKFIEAFKNKIKEINRGERGMVETSAFLSLSKEQYDLIMQKCKPQLREKKI